MIWEFDRIWDNKYSYSLSEPEFYMEFKYNKDTKCWKVPSLAGKIEDIFDIDFKEYFNN